MTNLPALPRKTRARVFPPPPAAAHSRAAAAAATLSRALTPVTLASTLLSSRCTWRAEHADTRAGSVVTFTHTKKKKAREVRGELLLTPLISSKRH